MIASLLITDEKSCVRRGDTVDSRRFLSFTSPLLYCITLNNSSSTIQTGLQLGF